MAARRPRGGWGKIKKLPSERPQASYVGPDLGRHSAPHTFTAQMDAQAWLIAERRLIEAETWTSPAQRIRKAEKTVTLREWDPDALTRRRWGFDHALAASPPSLPARGGRRATDQGPPAAP